MSGVQAVTFQNFLWNPQLCVNNRCGKCLLVALSVLFKMVTFGIPYCCCRPLKGRATKTESMIPELELTQSNSQQTNVYNLANSLGSLRVFKYRGNTFDVFNIFGSPNQNAQVWSGHQYTKRQLEVFICYSSGDSGYQLHPSDENIRIKLAQRGLIYFTDKNKDLFKISETGLLCSVDRSELSHMLHLISLTTRGNP